MLDKQVVVPLKSQCVFSFQNLLKAVKAGNYSLFESNAFLAYAPQIKNKLYTCKTLLDHMAIFSIQYDKELKEAIYERNSKLAFELGKKKGAFLRIQKVLDDIGISKYINGYGKCYRYPHLSNDSPIPQRKEETIIPLTATEVEDLEKKLELLNVREFDTKKVAMYSKTLSPNTIKRFVYIISKIMREQRAKAQRIFEKKAQRTLTTKTQTLKEAEAQRKRETTRSKDAYKLGFEIAKLNQIRQAFQGGKDFKQTMQEPLCLKVNNNFFNCLKKSIKNSDLSTFKKFLPCLNNINYTNQSGLTLMDYASACRDKIKGKLNKEYGRQGNDFICSHNVIANLVSPRDSLNEVIEVLTSSRALRGCQLSQKKKVVWPGNPFLDGRNNQVHERD